MTMSVPVERGGGQCRGTIGIRRIIFETCSCEEVVVVVEFSKKRRSTGNGVRIIISRVIFVVVVFVIIIIVLLLLVFVFVFVFVMKRGRDCCSWI